MNKKKRQPEKINGIIDSVLSQSGYLNICKEHIVLTKWPEIVGPAIARYSECSRVEDGILYVRVKSAPWRHEISYHKRTILSQIAQTTGCTSIKDIVLH